MLALIVYLAIIVVRACLSVRYAKSVVATPCEPGSASDSVTVLQPILGGDPSLQAALQENLATADASTHFIWLVDEDDETGRSAAVAAAKAFADRVTIQLCPAVAQNMNPKTSKLQLGLANVQTPFVAVLDDDTVIDAATLSSAVAALDDCDLYTGLPCYRRGKTVWSSLVAHFVNSSAVTTYLPLLGFMSPLTINGMFYVMRTESFSQMGGFEAIKDQLCDDYAVAKLVRSHGGTLKQGISVQHLQTHVRSVPEYIRLMRRWFIFAEQLVRDQSLKFQILLVVMLGLPPLLLWLGMGVACGGAWGLAALITAWVLRHFTIRWTHRRVYGALRDFNFVHSLLAEMLQPMFWLLAFRRRKFRWRTRTIRLLEGGRFEYLESGPGHGK